MRLLARTLLVAAMPVAVVAALMQPASADPPGHHHNGHQQVTGCTLTVPADPTSAAGLATPYQLGNGCHEAEVTTSTFVEAVVLDPASGALGVYHPVVVDAGSTPAVAPVPVTLPAHAVVGVWFGSNADTVTLIGPGAHQAVNGLGGSVFGQFAYIGAPHFFAAAHRAIAAGMLVVPPLGVGNDGAACPSTRAFYVVDQDQSDNLATAYRVIGGKIAQDTAATAAGAKLTNGSDEGLVANFLDPMLGCHPFTAPDLDNPGHSSPALALNELSAAANQAAPVALVPENDPMTLVNGKPSVAKTVAYRLGVDQSPAGVVRSAGPYCTTLRKVAPVWLAAHKAAMAAWSGPGGLDLNSFMTARYAASLVALGCP